MEGEREVEGKGSEEGGNGEREGERGVQNWCSHLIVCSEPFPLTCLPMYTYIRRCRASVNM